LNFYNNFSSKQLKIAHRGYCGVRPENTFCAFENSIGKCDFIELDIQVTKDNELVVFHDETLKRTTDIETNKEFAFNGSYNLCDYRLEELCMLDVGSWFDTQYTNQRILTLKDVLVFCERNNIALNIELKDCSNINDEAYIKKLIDVIQSTNMTIPLLISSFNDNYLKLLKKEMPTMDIALNIESNLPIKLVSFLKELNVCAVHISKDLVNDISIEDLKKNNIMLSVFTVNDTLSKINLYQQGVDAIFTNYP
jgi:glycerophosphoryl diester phosphodiesterase